MSVDRDAILRELGQKMLDEIDLLMRRLNEELQTLLRAPARIEEITARLAVLQEERDKLIARGQRPTRASPVEVTAMRT